MFSGIVDQVGEVVALKEVPGGCTLGIRAPGYWRGIDHGASIAIDGVCLTVTRVADDDAMFDVVAETLRRSTLGRLRTGHRVNLQKSLKAGDSIDGHFVQGHVDAIGRIARVEESPAESKWWYEVDGAARCCMIPKGSVAVDGISLTIADVSGPLFSTALIPTTLARTTLGSKREGDHVNIETDIIARVVLHHLEALGGDLLRPGTAR
ncbi:MAG: riboflavin synthase [Planctomycetota bacterium]|nr:MAG: riboflavin synthase [Planctomycetota bacterium]